MSTILHIETATDVCSVSLAHGGKLIAKRENSEGRLHASLLTVLINELLDETGTTLDAVAVSKGPGSYTGLRIGVSVAKGLCYGGDLPLISIPTMQSMLNGFLNERSDLPDTALLAPMLDARRMEVYTALYSMNRDLIKDTSALIIDESSFAEILNEKPLYLFGDGADKLEQVLSHKNLSIIKDFKLSSEFMIELASHKYMKNDFEDLAYFVPFYLKDFITTVSKKNILQPHKKS